MNVTFKDDRMYINSEPLDMPDAPEVYAELLVSSLYRSMECSPQFQHHFFAKLKPLAEAYYGWRITSEELTTEYEEYLSADDEDAIYDPDDKDDDDELLDVLVSLKIALNESISKIAELKEND